MKILQLDIHGFRSLRKVSWRPGSLNVIIGPNGSGKSNLLRFLELIAASSQGKLGSTIQSLGGMEPLVWDGQSARIQFTLTSEPAANSEGTKRYGLELIRLGSGSSYKIGGERLDGTTHSDGLPPGGQPNDAPSVFLERQAKNAIIFDENRAEFVLPEGYVSDEESVLSIAAGPFINNRAIPPFQNELAAIAVYRPLNTSQEAPIRHPVVARMERRVAPDGQNLIPVLHTLYTGDRNFKNDVNGAMRAAFGDDFDELLFPPAADQRIQMRIRWKSLKREQSAAELSDGTLCFLYLLTILASPSPAPLIAIDEPESGLHPSMLPVVAEFAAAASKVSQIILATHSPQLLDAFGEARPTITVTKWENGETTLHTIKDADLAYWLQEYSFGSLFKSGELENMQ